MFYLFTRNNSYNLILLWILLSGFFIWQNLPLFSQNKVYFFIYLIATWILGLFVYKLGAYLDLKPGEDYLAIYLYIFLADFSFDNYRVLLAGILILLGFAVITRVTMLERLDRLRIFYLSVLYAIASLFYEPFVVYFIFLLLIIVLNNGTLRDLVAVVVGYIVVYYFYFSLWLISSDKGWDFYNSILEAFKYEMSAIDIGIGYIVNIFVLLWSVIFLTKNFFSFPKRIRKPILLFILFLLFSMAEDLILRSNLLFISSLIISLFFAFYLIKAKMKFWLKDAILLLIILIKILILTDLIG